MQHRSDSWNIPLCTSWCSRSWAHWHVPYLKWLSSDNYQFRFGKFWLTIHPEQVLSALFSLSIYQLEADNIWQSKSLPVDARTRCWVTSCMPNILPIVHSSDIDYQAKPLLLLNDDEQEGVLHLKTTFFWHFYTQTPFTSAPQAPQHSDKLICHDLNPLSPFRNMHTIPYYPTVSAPVCPPILSDCINYCYFTTI